MSWQTGDVGHEASQPVETTRHWRVAGGLVEVDGTLLLVANRRRDGRVDWSPPGGVIDAGEGALDALSREVAEETGLVVDTWSDAVYEVTVDFVSYPMTLHVVCHRALSWTGDIVLDDPDGIVIDAQFVAGADCHGHLLDAPAWVREPVGEWLSGPWTDARAYAYRAVGQHPGDLTVERVTTS